jgi:serine/threonine-protein kinase
MVMEYIEGDSLRNVMTTRGATIWESVRYIREVLAALSYAHGRGVVHRDIKPGNIMIAANGNVKLLDFGLASAARASQLTRSGAVMGSMHYMSPEQVQSMPADARSDLYSLGVTFYQLVTGALPIPGESEFALMVGHVNHIPIEPVVRNPSVPSPISAAIMRSLEKDPALRLQTAEAFLRALDDEETVTLTKALETSPAIGGIDPALIERATRELAQYIGPIARVIVRREMRSTGDWKQLRQRLAEEIPILRNREKFLAAVR